MQGMNESTLLQYLLPAVAAVGIFSAARYLARRQRERLHAQGLHLIYWLKAYAAWVDCQCDEPFTAHGPDELASPEPIARALRIQEKMFPQLAQHMLRLLQAHSRLVEYLWQQSLLRVGR